VNWSYGVGKWVVRWGVECYVAVVEGPRSRLLLVIWLGVLVVRRGLNRLLSQQRALVRPSTRGKMVDSGADLIGVGIVGDVAVDGM
jgi:hypothetical protein